MKAAKGRLEGFSFTFSAKQSGSGGVASLAAGALDYLCDSLT